MRVRFPWGEGRGRLLLATTLFFLCNHTLATTRTFLKKDDALFKVRSDFYHQEKKPAFLLLDDDTYAELVDQKKSEGPLKVQLERDIDTNLSVIKINDKDEHLATFDAQIISEGDEDTLVVAQANFFDNAFNGQAIITMDGGESHLRHHHLIRLTSVAGPAGDIDFYLTGVFTANIKQELPYISNTLGGGTSMAIDNKLRVTVDVSGGGVMYIGRWIEPDGSVTFSLKWSL